MSRGRRLWLTASVLRGDQRIVLLDICKRGFYLIKIGPDGSDQLAKRPPAYQARAQCRAGCHPRRETPCREWLACCPPHCPSPSTCHSDPRTLWSSLCTFPQSDRMIFAPCPRCPTSAPAFRASQEPPQIGNDRTILLDARLDVLPCALFEHRRVFGRDLLVCLEARLLARFGQLLGGHLRLCGRELGQALRLLNSGFGGSSLAPPQAIMVTTSRDAKPSRDGTMGIFDSSAAHHITRRPSRAPRLCWARV